VIGDLPPEVTVAPDGGSSDHALFDAAPDEHTDVVTPNDAVDAVTDAATDVPMDAADTDVAPCTTPVFWHPDADRDGHGRSDTAVAACHKPDGDWSLVADDCYDGDARVHLGQTAYFGTPYVNDKGVESFDFDCSGVEEPFQGQARVESCGVLDLTACDLTKGYAKRSRSGSGIDPFCGSTTLVECKALLGVLVCQMFAETVADEPYRCR